MASPDFDRNFSSATRFSFYKKEKKTSCTNLFKTGKRKEFSLFSSFVFFSSELTPKEIMKKKWFQQMSKCFSFHFLFVWFQQAPFVSLRNQQPQAQSRPQQQSGKVLQKAGGSNNNNNTATESDGINTLTQSSFWYFRLAQWQTDGRYLKKIVVSLSNLDISSRAGMYK